MHRQRPLKKSAAAATPRNLSSKGQERETKPTEQPTKSSWNRSGGHLYLSMHTEDLTNRFPCGNHDVEGGMYSLGVWFLLAPSSWFLFVLSSYNVDNQRGVFINPLKKKRELDPRLLCLSKPRPRPTLTLLRDAAGRTSPYRHTRPNGLLYRVGDDKHMPDKKSLPQATHVLKEIINVFFPCATHSYLPVSIISKMVES